MGIFNEHRSTSSSDTVSSGEGPRGAPGPAGPRGAPGPAGSKGDDGNGFKLNSDGNYDLENKKLTNVRNGDNDNDVMVKSQIEEYVNNKIQSAGSQSSDSSNFVKKTGSTMSGDLILQSQPYPILGNTNKAISYNTARNVFLSKKEGGSMEQTLDMNNREIFNVKDPTAADQAANKKYVDTQLATKLDKADAKKYVNVDGSNGMTGNLNLNEKNNNLLEHR